MFLYVHNKQPSRTHVTSVQFEPDGDVITADSDGNFYQIFEFSSMSSPQISS